MTTSQRVQEQYEDALFALLMDDFARTESEEALQELREHGDDPAYAVSSDLDCRNLKVISRCCAKKRKHTAQLKTGLVAAIIIICFIAAMTLPVAGYANLFQMVGCWSAEQFEFKALFPESQNIPANNSGESAVTTGADLRSILIQNHIDENVLPKRIPEGFELLEDISVYEFGGTKNLEIDAFYVNGEKTYTVSVIRHNTLPYDTVYEKDDGEVEIYVAGGIEHYIFSNLSFYTAAWCVDNLECSISTNLPKEDLLRDIDSIYEE